MAVNRPDTRVVGAETDDAEGVVLEHEGVADGRDGVVVVVSAVPWTAVW